MPNEDKIEVYNNGNGWRVAFKFQGAIRVLTLDEMDDLVATMDKARDMIWAELEKAWQKARHG